MLPGLFQLLQSVPREQRAGNVIELRLDGMRLSRLKADSVSRTIAKIGDKAGIVVRKGDKANGVRTKHASAHDLRRGCAQRLINSGVSAETLKVIMRHADFDTTEKHYGAIRSAQTAADELFDKVELVTPTQSLVRGLTGGNDESLTQVSEAESS